MEKRAFDVREVQKDGLDFAGDRIVCVYSYTPPDYAVYRTRTRVMVHFSNDAAVAAQQRARIACLTPLRGQINSLIDGWHSAGGPAFDRRAPRDDEDLPKGKNVEHPLRRRAARYDRRVADAIVVGLDGKTDLAVSLLAEIKNDIISERITIARMSYLGVALGLGIFITLVMYGLWLVSEKPVNAIWTGVSGGTLGALFSIALGLKGRTVLIDLQQFQNVFDAILRMLIGAISGGMLLCLFLSGLVSNVIKDDQLSSTATSNGPSSAALLVFAIGFLGGFFERLVPDLLSKTNLGTEEEKGGGKGTAAVQGGSIAAEGGADQAGQQAPLQGGAGGAGAGAAAPKAAPAPQALPGQAAQDDAAPAGEAGAAPGDAANPAIEPAPVQGPNAGEAEPDGKPKDQP